MASARSASGAHLDHLGNSDHHAATDVSAEIGKTLGLPDDFAPVFAPEHFLLRVDVDGELG